MEAAGLTLAVPGVVQLCLRCGRDFAELCSSFRNAHDELSESLLHVANDWVRLETLLTHVDDLEPLMKGYHHEIYMSTLSTLKDKLQAVSSILRGVVKPVPGAVEDEHTGVLRPKRLKHAFKQGGLDRSIQELKTWMESVDLTWFLILRMMNSQVDMALAKRGPVLTDAMPSILHIRASLRGSIPDEIASQSLSKSHDVLEDLCLSKIPLSNALLATRPRPGGEHAILILSRINYPPLAQLNEMKKETRGLAQRLQHQDPDTFGLLNCAGFITRMLPMPSSPLGSSVESTLLFDIPPGRSYPRSLRDFLITEPSPDSLTSRMALARELAKAVGFVHVFGFVHKNIRPESVLLLKRVAHGSRHGYGNIDGSYFHTPPSAFLVGFDHFRTEEGRTQRLGDETFDANLYRHPDRQGPSRETVYSMQHDIYSLGVCLLEIGLWRSLVEYECPPFDDDAIEKGTMIARPSTLLGAPADASSGGRLLKYVLVSGKSRLLTLAREELARAMGTQFLRVVETCLTCLDEDNDDFGDQAEFEDADGIIVGARYIEKVILRLSMISL